MKYLLQSALATLASIRTTAAFEHMGVHVEYLDDYSHHPYLSHQDYHHADVTPHTHHDDHHAFQNVAAPATDPKKAKLAEELLKYQDPAAYRRMRQERSHTEEETELERLQDPDW